METMNLPRPTHTINRLKLAFAMLPATLLLLFLIPAAVAQNHHFASLQMRLISDGFEENAVRELYARPQVTFESKGISVYFVHHESKVDYDQYTDTRLIRRAKDYMQRNAGAFDAVEKTYGVNREVITAIILVETQLGKLLGSRSVLNTLSTMAALSDPQVRDWLWVEVADTPDLTRRRFDEKAVEKSRWAYRELKAYLRHAQQEGFDPVRVNGSFAGAMGIAQFMPSNIDQLARDGNGDGRIDLFDDADAIASIAYYLQRHGWRPGIDRQTAEKVVYHYNHSERYVGAILKISDLLKG
jgi:membrane-bound lytic murein transglycosylase B